MFTEVGDLVGFKVSLIHSVACRMDGFSPIVCLNDLGALNTVYFGHNVSSVSIVSKYGMIKTDEH